MVCDEVAEDGESANIDVDLPEIEDMPTQVTAVYARALKVS
jgi:hypothetical protein